MKRFACLVALAALLGAAVAAAEDQTGRLGLGLEGGFMKGVWGDQDYSNVDQNARVHLRRGLSPHWSLDLSLMYGWLRPGVGNPDEQAKLTWDADAGLYTVMWQPRAGFLYHLSPHRRLSPLVGASVGLTAWKVKDMRGIADVGLDPGGPTLFGYDEDGRRQELQRTDFTASVTAGIEFAVSHSLLLGVGARYHHLPGNDLDNVGLSGLWGPEHVDANRGLVETYAGLTLLLGSADADGDGVPDRRDRCPDTPRGVRVDAHGCPLDSDGDGVPDHQDECPDTPAGVRVDARGCPLDSDGDGVPDHLDRCPGTPAGVKVDAHGCPLDSDGDGVPDHLDRCPDTPAGALVNEEGCPPPPPRPEPAPAAELIEIKPGEDLVLEGVNFKTGSAELTPESNALLDRVARSLLANPEVTVEVRGHTDSVGAAEANRSLSQRRAVSVRDYLVAQGVTPQRLTAVGYGEDRPIADNASAEGRARNRRVELHRTDQ